MTSDLVAAFPTPGPLLGLAYRSLWLASEGSDNQKAAVGDPSQLAKPWDPPTCRQPQLRAELWAWLDAVVTWLNREYVWEPGGLIPACWPLHPHLVHEIAVLADQRRRAGMALDSDALEDFHRYTLPGFQDRLRGRLRSHCEHEHQPAPGRARLTRHQDATHVAARQAAFRVDVDALGPPVEPDLHRPRLTLIDSDTGEIVDGQPDGGSRPLR